MYNIPIKEIAQALSIEYQGADNIIAKRVVFDSRQVQAGDLFVAIRGNKVDGHAYISQAIAAGAVAIAVDQAHSLASYSAGCLVVEDGTEFIQRLSVWMRKQFNGPVIAITGSQGKTSTKDLLAQVCSKKYKIVVTEENQNNELGLPLTMTKLDEQTDILIVEMGMTGFGEIDFLCQLAAPTHAIITGIGTVHAEFLGSQQGIARAKTELFRYLPHEGYVALRRQDEAFLSPYLDECKATIEWCDANGKEGTFYATNMILAQDESRFICHTADGEMAISVPFAGRHFVDNSLLVIAIAKSLEIANEDIVDALAYAVPLSANRMEMHLLDKERLLINDCYNANPDSMIATLDVLAGYQPRPTIACLGNMYELGTYEESGHRQVGEYLAKLGIDYLICLGNKAEHIGSRAIEMGMPLKNVFNVDTTKQAAYILAEYMPENAVVLVKGSNSMNMAEILKKLKPLLS